MKRALWVVLLTATTLFAGWAVFGSWFPQNVIVLTLVFLFFGIHPLGAFWMIYDCARYEKEPHKIIFASFIPYGFVWYYFDRVRPRRARQQM